MLNKLGRIKNFFLCSEVVIAAAISMVNQSKDFWLSAIKEKAGRRIG